ncbi:MAG TPA: TetR/AcrR family transcriptional regulator [Vicinamibacterales bacterium]|nr:TetR/AcrR family transcriptional regulator [Vicinamibacterales bacterium]
MARVAPTPRWQRRPDERPDALMASAFRLLLRDGYRRVRLDAIAADAGVSKATVYHYFANKDDLLTQSVSARMAERQRDIERRLASDSGRASDRLTHYLRQFWTMSLTPQAGVWQRLLVNEIVTEAPDVFAAWARGLVQRWRLVERLIREGQARREFRRDVDAEVAARAIVSALSHQALLHVHFGVHRFARCAPERLFTSTVECFLEGLRPSPRRRPDQ